MIASELRIGNWVLVPYPAPVLIPSVAMKIDGSDYYGNRLIFGTDPTRHPLTWDLKHCTGIPLTEEWLIKLGFTKEREGCYSVSIDDKILFGYWIEDGAVSIGAFLPKHYKYVHQLQNLFHAITGEELTIKE